MMKISASCHFKFRKSHQLMLLVVPSTYFIVTKEQLVTRSESNHYVLMF